MKKIAIFLNGEYSSDNPRILECVKGRKVIAVDGGLNKVHELNLNAHKIVGDMDSVDNDILISYSFGIEIVKLEKNKDDTDFEVALQEYINDDNVDILVLGATGKRIDMSLSNLKSLHKVKNMKFLTENFEIVEYIDKSAKFLKLIGKTFSIIPIENIQKLTLKGFRYPLTNKDISKNSALVSNVVEENMASIEFEKGSMYIVYEM